MQTMCEVYAAVSYISIGDAESTSQVYFLSVIKAFPFQFVNCMKSWLGLSNDDYKWVLNSIYGSWYT